MGQTFKGEQRASVDHRTVPKHETYEEISRGDGSYSHSMLHTLRLYVC